MKTDFLGEYDEYAIPLEFEAPLKLDTDNNGIACANGRILGLYNFVNESVMLAHAKRRAEFAVRMANGEVIVDNGRVYKLVGSQYQDGRIVVSYEPVGGESMPDPEKVAENGHSESNQGIVETVLNTVKKGRGRPRKNG